MVSSGFSEVKGFGTAEPDWPARPERHGVAEVAAHFLRHRVAAYLRTRKITAGDIAEQLEGAEAAWRSRLNTNRGMSTDELVALFLLFPDLVDEAIPHSGSVDDWLPPSYAGLAVRPAGSGMPAFRSTDVDWGAVSSAVAQWWSAGVDDGTTAWSVDAKVLTHHILQQLDTGGLARRLAAPASAGISVGGPVLDMTSIQVDWAVHDTSVRVLWLSPFTVPDGDQVRTLLAEAAAALWADRADAFASDVTVVAAPPPVSAAVRLLIRESDPDSSRSAVFSIRDAHRLGVRDPASRPDLYITELDDGAGPLLWLLVKT